MRVGWGKGGERKEGRKDETFRHFYYCRRMWGGYNGANLHHPHQMTLEYTSFLTEKEVMAQ
jgi:hypothetical protein